MNVRRKGRRKITKERERKRRRKEKLLIEEHEDQIETEGLRNNAVSWIRCAPPFKLSMKDIRKKEAKIDHRNADENFERK